MHRDLVAKVVAFGAALSLASCAAGAPARPPETTNPTPVHTAGPTATPPSSVGPSALYPTSFAPTGPTQTATVTRIVDGDTIHVSIDGHDYRLRYIGMDAPETVKPNEPVEWMGPQATTENTQLVSGQTVVLEKDVSETDQYGRLLRYVWLHGPNGWLLVDGELVRLGYARAKSYPPDTKYDALLAQLQQSAQAAGLGLWGTPPTTTTAGPVPFVGGGGKKCDPAYPDFCIPPPPPDLDCRDVAPHVNFTVLPPDPHHFDGDHNGIGCEKH